MGPHVWPKREPRPIEELWAKLNPVLDAAELLPRRHPDGSLATPPPQAEAS